MDKNERTGIVILCTTPDNKTAKIIAQSLLNNQLAACINIIPEIHSLYVWNNKLEQTQETQMIIKTTQACFSHVQEHINSQHPYDTPEIIEIPITNGAQNYLTWLFKECKHA